VSRARWLAGFAVVYLAAFALLRSTSPVVRIAARRDEAARVAAASGLQVEETLALLDLAGPRLGETEWLALAQEAAAAAARHGDLGLGVAAALGHGDLVRELHGGAAPAEARARLRARREGIVLARFDAMVARYRALCAPPERR